MAENIIRTPRVSSIVNNFGCRQEGRGYLLPGQQLGVVRRLAPRSRPVGLLLFSQPISASWDARAAPFRTTLVPFVVRWLQRRFAACIVCAQGVVMLCWRDLESSISLPITRWCGCGQAAHTAHLAAQCFPPLTARNRI